MLASFLFLAAATQQVSSQPAGKIAVEGYGTVMTPPDLASLHYNIRGEGKTSDLAAKALVGADRAVLASISRLDSKLVVTDSNLEIKPLRGPACKATSSYESDDDDATPMESGACAIIGYQASKRVNVETVRVDLAGTILGLVARHGGLNAELDSFSLRNDRPAKEQAIAAALREADVKAKAVAAGSNVRLGPILSITLDRARIDDPYVPTFLRPPPPEPERDDPVGIDVRPSPVSTSAQVAVIYGVEK